MPKTRTRDQDLESLTARFTPYDLERLRRLAAREERPMGYYVRQALTRYLDAQDVVNGTRAHYPAASTSTTTTST